MIKCENEKVGGNIQKKNHLMKMAFITLGVANATSFEELEQIASDLVDQVQTGALSESLNLTVEDFAMTEPAPEPEDPTGGIRATNESGKSVCKIYVNIEVCSVTGIVC